MLNTTQLKEYAQLTQATYAYFNSSHYRNNQTLLDQITKLGGSEQKGANFSELEARQFTDRYELLHQSDNNDSSGFSASLFRDKQSGRLIVSFRGTEPFGAELANDLLIADSRIGLDGYASPQAIQTFRYIKQLLTPAGQTVQYAEQELDGLKAVYLDRADSPIEFAARLIQWNFVKSSILADTGIDAGQGLGVALLQQGSIPPPLLVGHSLGGHLAMLAARMLPGLNAEVVTLNAPDFFFQSEAVLQIFGSTWGALNIKRMEAAGDGISEIGNIHPGTRILLGQENESGVLASLSTNHDKVNSADGLALAELMGKLDARLAKAFIDQAAAIPGQSYELLLDGLRRMILGNGITATPFNDSTTPVSRNPFYVNISELGGNAAFQALSGKVSFLSAANLDPALARSNFGVFLALRYLTPFVLQTSDSTAISILENAHKDLSQAWEDDQALTHEQRRQGQANFSDEYLSDRATMLKLKLKLAVKDFISTESNPYVEPGLSGQLFDDRASGTTIFTGTIAQPLPDKRRFIFGTEGDDKGSNAIVGANKNDNLYGGAGIDELRGNGGNDHLEGNAGDDELYGGDGDDTLIDGAGDDKLYGGTGFDTYIVGQGRDTIIDEDGLGVVKDEQGRVIAGAFIRGADGRYTWANQASVGATRNSPLTITLENGSQVVVENYDGMGQDRLGLRLVERPGMETAGLRLGDRPVSSYPERSGEPPLRDGPRYDWGTRDAQGRMELGITYVDIPEEWLNARIVERSLEVAEETDSYVVYRTTHLVMAYSTFEDTLTPIYGEEIVPREDVFRMIGATTVVNWRIETGQLSDFVVGGAGNDLIAGGADPDVLMASNGDDTVFGGEIVDVNPFIEESRTVAGTGRRGDWISGGRGKDTLVGTHDDDVVFGGGGEDLLVGGAGDDVRNGMALAAGQSQSAHAGEFAATNNNAWREAA